MKIRCFGFGGQGRGRGGLGVTHFFEGDPRFHVVRVYCCFFVVTFYTFTRWRCGVVTTKGGIAGAGSGHLLGREHASTPQSGVEAPPCASASSRKKAESP